MTRRLLGLAIAAATAAACSLNATMIPVAGPLSEQRPVPTLQVKATGVGGSTGDLSWTMPDGETCRGRWSSTDTTRVAVGGGSLISQYGSTYLSGYSLESGGMNRGAGLATCTKGRAFDFEFVSQGHGFGIGKDNANNIYRFVF